MDVNWVDDSVSMLNRERFFDAERERRVIRRRSWPILEFLREVVNRGQRRQIGKEDLSRMEFIFGDSTLPPADFD